MLVHCSVIAFPLLDYRRCSRSRRCAHISESVHHAYVKHAEVTLPSLDDWEETFWTGKNAVQPAKPKAVPVDFQGR